MVGLKKTSRRRRNVLAHGAWLWLAAPLAAHAGAPASATLEGNIEASTSMPEVDPQSLLPAADARAAIEAKLADAAACAADARAEGTYKLALDVDAAGKVAARGLEGADPAALTCVAAALGGAQLPALTKPEASLTLTLAVKLTAAVVDVPVPVATPAAPATSPAPAADSAKTAPAPTAAAGSVEATAAPAEETKPWSVSASLSQYLGQGAFVKDSYAAAPAYGYVIALRGSYKVTDMIRASLALSGSQQLTVTNQDGATPYTRAFYMGDIGLSASAAQLYKDEQYTGVTIGASLGFTLPISVASQAAEQITSITPAVTLSRSFENLGPGTLSLALASSVRFVVGPQARTLDMDEAASVLAICREANRVASGECLTASANGAYAFNNNLSVSYTFLEDFTASLSFGVSNSVRHYLGDSAMPARIEALGQVREGDIGESVNLQAQRNQTDMTTSSIALTYAVNQYFSVTGSLATAQDPLIQNADGTRSLRFPFWDFNSEANNLSTFNLDVAFTY